MGLTHLKLKIINPINNFLQTEVEFLVDSGATYTFLDQNVLKKLKIKPFKELEFVLADGSVLKREVGEVIFEYKSNRGTSPVVFAEKGDANLLGVVTLETMGLLLNPIKRELMPMKMVAM